MKYEFLFSADRICNATVTMGFSAQIQNLVDMFEKRTNKLVAASAAFAKLRKNDSVARNGPCCISKSFAAPRRSLDQSDFGTRANRKISDGFQVWRCFPSLKRVAAHSNMRAVVLCRNFSSIHDGCFERDTKQRSCTGKTRGSSCEEAG